MQIYLARNNQQAGPYSLEQLNQMLSSQQVLLTDLAWHQGMTEWKALGELTEGKLFYAPTGYAPPIPSENNHSQTSIPNTYTNPSIKHVSVNKSSEPELASFSSRVIAKILDFVLWIPAAAIPSFFFNKDQFEQLTALQQKMQAATNSEQAIKLQNELIQIIPTEAWQAMAIYLIIMLGIQAYLLAKSGQSIGKKVTKIKIVDAENNSQVSLLRVFTLRTVIFIILNMLFMPLLTIIDLVFGLSKNRQTLHDKVAKTKVIKQ